MKASKMSKELATKELELCQFRGLACAHKNQADLAKNQVDLLTKDNIHMKERMQHLENVRDAAVAKVEHLSNQKEELISTR